MPERPDVVVLCGGAGTRLRAVTGDTPKGLASVAGQPFLELLLQQLQRQSFNRVILALGYQGAFIRSHFGDSFPGIELIYSTESHPMGTAGAIRNAIHLLASNSVLVMNGDSYTDVNLASVVQNHASSKADASIVLVNADDRTDCGFVLVSGNHVVGFNEKQPASVNRYVNAGIYAMCTELVHEIPTGCAVSLEREVIPGWLKDGRHVGAFIHPGKCVDIGTPDRYRAAQTLLAAV